MMDSIWFSLSSFLIFLIMIRPPKNIGLESITSKTDLLGSPSSAEKFLNNATISLIVIYSFVLSNIYLKI